MTGAHTRRRFLLGSAATVGAVGLELLPRSIRKVMAATPPSSLASLDQIEHIVFLMQENRSFDHYFGTLSGVRGYGDPEALRLSTGRSVFHQPDPLNADGYELPFHLDTITTGAATIPSLSHAWSVQHQAWNNGGMDNWVPAHRASDGTNGPLTMGHYTRADLPFHHALADAFTICDAYHCSVLGPTWPNRLYFMTGTIDPAGQNGGPMVGDSAARPLTWTTYPERLQAAGVSWRVYQESNSDGNNVLSLFAQYRQSPPTSPLRVNGMTVRPHGAFMDDVLRGELPQVSWILPPSLSIEHPNALPGCGAEYINDVLDALGSNPEVWARTVLFLTWDENDGYFDHVPPPTAPPGTPGEWITAALTSAEEGITGPVGLGFRVGMVVVSPFSRGGWVNGEVFDHTSMLRFVERRFGVVETNISAWRRSVTGDLTSTLRVGQGAGGGPALPDPGPPARIGQLNAQNLPAPAVPTVQTMPAQEPARMSLELRASPPFVSAGRSCMLTATLSNAGLGGGRPAVATDLSIALSVPAGWSSQRRPASLSSAPLPPGESREASWVLTAPSGLGAGAAAQLGAVATFRVNGGGEPLEGTVEAAYPLSAPSTLAQAFNQIGISDDSTRVGNLDGDGDTYSLQALGAAGLTPGATISHNGLTFTWPNLPGGVPNAVLAMGQPVLLSGRGATLGFLGASSENNEGGIGSVFYTDGTSGTYWLMMDNYWYAPPDNEIIATMPYLNRNGSQRNHTVHVFYAGVPIDSGKTVWAVTLPTGTLDPPGKPISGMHLFAIAIGGS